MLPRADCVFTLPSLSDDIELQCRLYFPRRPPNHLDAFVSGFAILAHPYAPLGGCYDDPVVQLIGLTLLSQGMVLCTFNFRGAMGSAGSTSWTGKAELGDFVTIYTLMLHFVNVPGVLHHVISGDTVGTRPLLILGGYSYGSMIASHLPDLTTIQYYYDTSQTDSTDHRVQQRAQELAKVFLSYLESQILRESKSRDTEGVSDLTDSRYEVMLGGYDSGPAGRRINRESGRRSIDTSVRHGIDRVKRATRRLSIRAHDDHGEFEANPHHVPSLAFPVQVRIAYLLISPLLPPVAGFTTMFSKLSYEKRGIDAHPKSPKSVATNLSENPTLAIYGDKDVFTSARKLQKWAEELEKLPQSRFMSHGVPGAGHFWHEHGAQEQLCDIVREWAFAIAIEAQSNMHDSDHS